jgi:hypothetical protein
MTLLTIPTSPLARTLMIALGGSLLLAGGALAQSQGANQTSESLQETPAQARARAATSSLNGAPAETTLRPRPNALPPLSAEERPRPRVRPQAAPSPSIPSQGHAVAPSPSSVPVRAPTASRPTQPVTPAQVPPSLPTDGRPRPPSVTLAPGATEPEPIALPLGYYVRGDKSCDQVWPGEGDIAWLTPISFTIDFGGCEPGQFLQTGPNAWSEEQKCMTELGGDAGAYSVAYEVVAPGVLMRRAHLAIDDNVEEDRWTHCETADVPEEARFKS